MENALASDSLIFPKVKLHLRRQKLTISEYVPDFVFLTLAINENSIKNTELNADILIERLNGPRSRR